MLKKSSWFKNMFSQMPGFWFFQISGWLLMILLDFFQSYQEIQNHRAPYLWIMSLLTGFLISLLLRQWYKKIYGEKLSIYSLTLIISGSSITAGFIWYLMRIVVFNPVYRIIVEGENYEILMLPLYRTILRTLDYTWVFLIWSALYFVIKFWMELIEAKERSEKASLLAQKSQLQMLRYQLNPHFLFNSLNSIQALVYDDPKHADRMISELSDFLRFTLREKDKIFIPLGDEVKIVEKYLSMEKTRFPDRLEYSIDVTEQAEKLEVVGFILQPFVENAVKHGMKSSPEKLVISVKGYTEARRLFLEVKNTGKWIENPNSMGTGIQNVYARLQNAYPDKYKIHICKNPNSVYVIIDISL